MGIDVPASEHFIDGMWTPGSGERSIEVLDPSDDTPVGAVRVGTPSEVATAVAAARKAQHVWARTAPAERAAWLTAAAARVRAAVDELAELTTAEMGKPLGDARGGAESGANTLVQYAELGQLHGGRSLAGGWGATDLMVRQPRGTVAVITPWNDPVAVACGLLGAALVTGNTVVFKPSERTPHSGILLARLLAEGLPDGVLNLVNGDAETGSALASDPGIDLIAHVGSSTAGLAIRQAAARNGTAVLLENGGKDPLIVDAGVDPAWAASQAALGSFANAGQICVAVERIYVHRDVTEPFLNALVSEAAAWRQGSGRDAGTRLGPLVDRHQRDIVHGQVQQALGAGARALCGGNMPDGPGAFYPATVLADCTDDMAVMREETFGPVAPVRTVGSFDEALAAACDSPFGLAATVMTPNIGHAQRAWRELPVGTVKINAVFGGAPGGAAQPRGISGSGFGYGPELLDEMTTTKVVHLSPLPE